MKKLAALTLVGSAIAMACSVDATGTGEEAGSQEAAWDAQSVCTSQWAREQIAPQMEAEASLAVAAVDEFGDLESQENFYINQSTWALDVTTAGLNKCAARNKVIGTVKCPNVRAILSMQLDQPGGFRALNNYRNLLLTHFERYLSHYNNNEQNCKVRIGDLVPGDSDPNTSGVQSTTAGICAPYGNTNSFMYWYAAKTPTSATNGKLWCKTVAFGGPTAPTGQSENPFMVYKNSGNGVEGFDPVAQTPAPAPMNQAATANGNTAQLLGKMPYTNAATPGVEYTVNTTGAGKFAWSVPGQEIGCYYNGVAGKYFPHPLLPNTHSLCKPN